MPLSRNNQRNFQRKLFAGWLETVRILKRNDNQQMGTVRAVIVFNARRSIMTKTGQTIQHEMSSNHRCVWHIPKSELLRVGIFYINNLDRIEQLGNGDPNEKGFFWQPESTENIEVKLGGNEVDLSCLRVDPPDLSQQVIG